MSMQRNTTSTAMALDMDTDMGMESVEVNMNVNDNADPDIPYSYQESNRFLGFIRNYSKKRRLAMIAAGVLVLVAIISVSVAVASSNKSSSSNPSIGTVPVGDPSDQKNPGIYEEIYSATQRFGIDTGPLTFEGTPQYKAYQWLVGNEKLLATLDHDSRLQRYALAVFYYSTSSTETLYTPSDPPDWKSKDGWLEDGDECVTWKGIWCTSSKDVLKIKLENNAMTGALPAEMAFFDKLQHLDLTSNFIYMEGARLDVFGKMTALDTLLMDDNFITTTNGLPASFTNMSNLQKIRLSYNLLDGEIDVGILKGLTKLTHLEIESNFLNGKLPVEIGQMSSLVYLYLRRNDLDITLDFMKSGNMKEIFAIWLDLNNLITGTIPTEIGQLTELASLSLTDGSLTGTIPTEIANLEGLRRLWLYNNKLTGSLPEEIGLGNPLLEVMELHGNNMTGAMPANACSVIREATYTQKSLTADCDEVTCDDATCCTTCY